MRKIILSMNLTEDGFMAGQDGELDWHFPYWNLEMCESLCSLLSKADTILLGRKTYTALAEYWKWKGNDLARAREDIVLMNMMKCYSKVVVSKTLGTLPQADHHLIRDDVLSEIRRIKQKQGRDIIVFGSGRLVSYLIKHHLIDEYYLWVHPISIKHGKRISKAANLKFNLKPILVEHFSTGVTKLVIRNKM